MVGLCVTEPLLDEFDFDLRCLDAAFGFLLEAMKHIDRCLEASR
jgi:hypothetical protein